MVQNTMLRGDLYKMVEECSGENPRKDQVISIRFCLITLDQPTEDNVSGSTCQISI